MPDSFDVNQVTFFRDVGLNLHDSVLSSIEYIAKSIGTRVFFIDHVTAVFNTSGQEVKAIDSFLQRLQSLANRLGLVVVYNSHVKDPQQGDYSKGDIPTSSSFRGSGMLYRIPDVVLALGRQIEHPDNKHITTVKCIKHRQFGLNVGLSHSYTIENGRLTSCHPPINEGEDNDTDLADYDGF